MAQLLVVEDDETIGRVLLSSLAGAWPRSHRWAMTGGRRLRRRRLTAFDLVLLDLGLPDLDGIEVCRALRSVQPGAVLVVLTARDEEIDVVVGLEAGADDYLTKPFRLGELLARVHAHLRRSPPARPPPARGPCRSAAGGSNRPAGPISARRNFAARQGIRPAGPVPGLAGRGVSPERP